MEASRREVLVGCIFGAPLCGDPDCRVCGAMRGARPPAAECRGDANAQEDKRESSARAMVRGLINKLELLGDSETSRALEETAARADVGEVYRQKEERLQKQYAALCQKTTRLTQAAEELDLFLGCQEIKDDKIIVGIEALLVRLRRVRSALKGGG